MEYDIRDYIHYICFDWNKLKKLPKPSIKKIKSITNNTVKMFLFAFYNHNRIYRYNSVDLQKYINIHQDNLYLLASWLGNLNLMNFLEYNGLDINHTTTYGFSALFYATLQKNIDVIQYLLKKGLLCNLQNIDGISPLSWAIQNNCDEIVKYMNETKYNDIIFREHKDEECLICFISNNDTYIKCNYSHIYHLECFLKTKNTFCLFCFTEIL
jgi:ankyrin repeat protein